MNNRTLDDRRAPRWATIYVLAIAATVILWNLTLSNQINQMSQALTYALNARQVVVVPHHATMGGEAPTPVSGP